MSDVNLFIFGCIVFMIAAAGAFAFVYTRFRASYFSQGERASGPVQRRGARPEQRP